MPSAQTNVFGVLTDTDTQLKCFPCVSVWRAAHQAHRHHATLATNLPHTASSITPVSSRLKLLATYVAVVSCGIHMHALISADQMHQTAATEGSTCSDSWLVRQCTQAGRLVAGRMLRLGLQHGCARRHDTADSLRPIDDRLEVHRREATHIPGTDFVQMHSNGMKIIIGSSGNFSCMLRCLHRLRCSVPRASCPVFCRSIGRLSLSNINSHQSTEKSTGKSSHMAS